MKPNNEALKKHHFWILAGLAPLFVLIAIILMMTGVSTAISKEFATTDAVVKQVKTTRPAGIGVINDLGKQTSKLGVKKGELWQANWILQKEFFAWPKPPQAQFDKYAPQKFGTPLREISNEFEVFKRDAVYKAAYEEFPAMIAPTKFARGWQGVLRWVNPWGERNPKSEQIWLSLEDLWVQRAMVDPIRVVNNDLSRFDEVPGPQTTPLNKVFRNRVWEISLQVEDKGAQKIIKGKLKNRTGQLQLLGMGNTLRLNIWLDDKPGAQPMPFFIEGEFMKGEEEVEIQLNPSHILLPGVTPVVIAKVQQVLDERTVPIRRLDQLVLGYRSAKDATKELKAPLFWTDDPVAAATPTDAAAPSSGGARGAQTAGPGSTGGGTGTASAGALVGPPLTVLDANKKRYLEITDQVRRMPVALVVVVDQAYIPDVLIAYANSPFRFQVVQYHWKRFRDTLGNATGPATGPSASGPAGGPGMSSPDEGGIPGQIGDSLGNTGAGPRGGTMPGGLSGYPMGGGSAFPMGGSSGSSMPSSGTISEAQANSGLVELSVYGIISLYEQYDEKKDPTAKPAETPEPVKADPTPAAPMPVTPAPTTPAPTTAPPAIDPTKGTPPAADPAKGSPPKS